MTDPIYGKVEKGRESLYQRYFEEILTQIDVENFTAQTKGNAFDKTKLQSDSETVERIVNRAKETEGLLPVVLQVMVEQFFWADAFHREMHRNDWIYRVMNRKDTDYFPDSMTVYQSLFRD